jgi:hypothetical protein
MIVSKVCPYFNPLRMVLLGPRASNAFTKQNKLRFTVLATFGMQLGKANN